MRTMAPYVRAEGALLHGWNQRLGILVMINKGTCLVSALVCLSSAIQNLHADVALVAAGQSKHQIVVNADASPSEQFAAQELQQHIQACTGAELPIVKQAPAQGTPMIVLGCGPLAAKLGVKPSRDQLGPQGYAIRTVDPHIVIAGTPEVGTLYGVYQFLENCLGVRWYAPGAIKTPKAKDVTVKPIDVLAKPAFLIRAVSYRWPGRDAIFAARMRLNRNGQAADHPQGMGYSIRRSCHSYFSFISPGEFFATHPEYFSEIGGERFGAETQLCLTNPEVLEIVTQRMLNRMDSESGSQQYNFSQMDYYNYCECDKCTAINEKYGTLGGTQFWFVNKLAERTSKVHPDKLIGTLAYMYTEDPPKNMKMHPNVAVWLCHMFPSCDSHPIETCPLNADYKRRALAWSEICDHLYIWHYIVDFAHYYNPFPNLRAFATDLKFYRRIGVESVYLQAMGHGGGGGEFSLLRGYLAAKLAWNPDQDLDALIADFLNGYYGAAGPHIHQYVTKLHDKVADENIHMHLYTNPAQGYLPDEVMVRAHQLFDKAEQAVQGDDELLERVRVCRMPLSYAGMFPRNGYKIEDGQLHWLGDIAPQRDAVAFLNRMKKHGFRTIREWGGDPQQMIMLAGLFNSKVNIVTIESDHLKVEIVPVLAGRALRVFDKASGKCITAYNRKRVLMFPFCGGIENRVGETFRFHGWIEPATVTNRSDRSATIKLRTMDGWLLERTIELAADKADLKVVSKVTNPRDGAAEVRLRGHIEFDLGDLTSTRVRFTDLNGKRVDKDMTTIVANLREGEHYYDENAPAGEWTLSGTKGLAVTQRWDPKLVDFAWLYAYPDYLRQLDAEIWLKRKTLEPGQTLTFEQTLEIRPAR